MAPGERPEGAAFGPGEVELLGAGSHSLRAHPYHGGSPRSYWHFPIPSLTPVGAPGSDFKGEGAEKEAARTGGQSIAAKSEFVERARPRQRALFGAV
ncbi:MAG: hypothetical protein B6A08_09465 [Sorangiineae bacterium NIC37A_2]|nr:MAG: hypothetical protein B6A08_09465 [Sorangiineae bacterium NIC37A_2]